MTITLPEPLAFTDAASFLQREFPDPPWLVPNILPAGGCAVLGGPPKVAKSWLALDLAVAVISGGEFLGKPVEHHGRVMLVDAETPPQQLQARIRQLAAGRRIPQEDLGRLDILDKVRLLLDDHGTLERVLCAVAERRPTLVIVDPLREYHQREENSASEMSPFLGNLRELTRVCESTLLVVHHAGKGDTTGRRNGATLRGSTALWGWYDAALFVKRENQDIEIAFESRYTTDQPTLNVRLTMDTSRDIEVATIDVLGLPAFQAVKADTALALLERHPDGLTQRVVRDTLRASNTTIRAALQELLDQGFATSRTVGRSTMWTATTGQNTGLGQSHAVPTVP